MTDRPSTRMKPQAKALEPLVARIAKLPELVPEQISAPPPAEDFETDAVLIDQWGRLHALRPIVVVGREPTTAIAVLQTSISRRHAELRYDLAEDTWTVVDLGSRNGTTLEGVTLVANQPVPLGDRQLVVFGDVGFVFVAERDSLPAGGAPLSHATAQSASAPSSSAPQLLRISTPTQEGAGLAAYADNLVSLGPTQFALLRLLAERFLAATAETPEVRGFVRSIDLLDQLPWNTAHPEDNHVKQQVRRLRRALERVGLPEAIESRHGFGYRLRIAPILD